MEGVNIMPEIRKGTFKVQKAAVSLAPVGTPESTGIKGYVGGTLKGSIRVGFQKKSQSGIVYTNVEYAIYQEFGTRFQKGKAFLLPALKQERAGIRKSIENSIRTQLKAAKNGAKLSPESTNGSDTFIRETTVTGAKKVRGIKGFRSSKKIDKAEQRSNKKKLSYSRKK